MKKILVVEDNPDNREIICEFLAAYHFEIIPAKDGQEGIELFRSSAPDLVISDVLLPKINGRNLCQLVKKESSDKTPVILISALYKSYSLQVEAKEKYGADDYMIKPLNLLELVEKISVLLDIAKPQVGSKSQDSAGSAKGAPPNKGTIAGTILLDLFKYIQHDKLTGALKTIGTACSRTLYFQDGKPIYVSSNDSRENFAFLLVEDNKVAPDVLADLEKKAKSQGTTLGKLLVETKTISKKELAHYLIVEVQHRFEKLIGDNSGQYELIEDKSVPEKIKRAPFDVENQIYKAIQTIDGKLLEDRYRNANKKVLEKVETRLEAAGNIEWGEEDLSTFALIDGEISLDVLLKQSPQSASDVLKIVFTLEVLGIIALQ